MHADRFTEPEAESLGDRPRHVAPGRPEARGRRVAGPLQRPRPHEGRLRVTQSLEHVHPPRTGDGTPQQARGTDGCDRLGLHSPLLYVDHEAHGVMLGLGQDAKRVGQAHRPAPPRVPPAVSEDQLSAGSAAHVHLDRTGSRRDRGAQTRRGVLGCERGRAAMADDHRGAA